MRTRKADKAKPNSRFENYFAYQESVVELSKPRSSHRYLAMRRGWMEEELVLSVGGALPAAKPDDAPPTGRRRPRRSIRCWSVWRRRSRRRRAARRDFAGAPLLTRAARTALRAYVVPAIENEVHKALRDVADEAAIEVFAENVRKLLLSAPFGPKAVLGVDPGLRTGCKLAVVDDSGEYVGSQRDAPRVACGQGRRRPDAGRPGRARAASAPSRSATAPPAARPRASCARR